MKIARILILLILPISALFADASFPLSQVSYIQRGILKYDDSEFPLTAYVIKKDGSTILSLQSNAGELVKIALDKNFKLEFVKTSKIFPKSIAKRFVVRDFAAIMGDFDSFSGREIDVDFDAKTRAKSVKCGGYILEFLNYKTAEGSHLEVPQKIKISTPDYSLEFNFVKILK